MKEVKDIIKRLESELKEKEKELKTLQKEKASEYAVERCHWQIDAIKNTMSVLDGTKKLKTWNELKLL